MAGGYQEKAFSSDDEARVAILRALEAHNGSERDAAEALGLGYRTMVRYVARLGLREEIRRIKRSRATSADDDSSNDYAALAAAGTTKK